MHPQTDAASPEDGDTEPRARIERAVSALDDLDALPLAEHVARFEDAHSALAAALSSIDRV
ncbi:hypothetical protein [Saccharomonospora iraqiensis]|uniref:hypothetical protein n=1 Tax=Saccharomonospora iraqiensis TaxID=52698 RepID=UPI00022DF0D8|nr:hypothetical protein [Saccharomonospora iraqiensis]